VNSKRFRILLANVTLASRTGTETALRDLAVDLQAAGHVPMVYSPALGELPEAETLVTIDAAGVKTALVDGRQRGRKTEGRPFQIHGARFSGRDVRVVVVFDERRRDQVAGVR
jgi:hypothetical protein